jgi:hypothetical protein
VSAQDIVIPIGYGNIGGGLFEVVYKFNGRFYTVLNVLGEGDFTLAHLYRHPVAKSIYEYQ